MTTRNERAADHSWQAIEYGYRGGTTRVERDVMRKLDAGWQQADIARSNGWSKERASKIAKKLVARGMLKRLDWYRFEVLDRSQLDPE